MDSKKEKKKIHPGNFPKVVARFLAKHDANWHRVETCRVPLPRLVSPHERRKEEGEGEREKELARSPEPRSIFLRAISSFTVDQPTLYARAFSPDGSIRRMRKRIATGSYPSPSPAPPSSRAPFAPPTEDPTQGGRLDGGALFTVPEHVADHEERILTAVMWPGGSVRRASLHPSCVRCIDESTKW